VEGNRHLRLVDL